MHHLAVGDEEEEIEREEEKEEKRDADACLVVFALVHGGSLAWLVIA